MIQWRIYYADGTTFDNTMGEPWESPEWGAVCVQQRDPILNSERLEGEFFIWRPAIDDDPPYWSFHDLLGYVDTTVHYGRYGLVIRPGRYIFNGKIYTKFRPKVVSDPDFADAIGKAHFSTLRQL